MNTYWVMIISPSQR